MNVCIYRCAGNTGSTIYMYVCMYACMYVCTLFAALFADRRTRWYRCVLNVICICCGERTNNNTILTYISVYCNNPHQPVVSNVIPTGLISWIISWNHPIYRYIFSLCEQIQKRTNPLHVLRARSQTNARQAPWQPVRDITTQTDVTSDTRSGATLSPPAQ